VAYSFDRQLAQGEQGETFLDGFFLPWFTIRRATREEQRQGIDRWFVDARKRRQSIEYKTDSAAGRTGNAFVETVSVDTTNKPGWAYSSQAETLIYYIPDDGLIYVIRMAHLRLVLPAWVRKYPTRAVPNAGYRTHGLLVPLHEFEDLAVKVFSV